METVRLNLLDELYLHLDRDDEPWSVHLEIRVDGPIERDRLEAAVREAALRHPIARARLVPPRATDVRYQWEIAGELGELDIDEVDGDLASGRERLLSRTPSLDSAGPFALLLAHGADGSGDSLVLNLHHAAGDGLAALRLMGSIARAYGGEEDPLPDVDPLEVRDVGALTSPGSLRERVARGRAALEYLTRGVSAPSRIAGAGGADGRPGYGFELLSLEPEDLERLRDLRRGSSATVNDVLLGALALTVRRWNERHDVPYTDAVYLMMPINLRPPEWRYEVVGNFASYVSVRVGSSDHATLDGAVRAAADSTRRIKEGGLAGLIVDLFSAPTLLPTALKQRMGDLIPLTGNLAVDTAVLSNLGRVESVPSLGAGAGPVREAWFSPPGRMPLGASLGAVTLDGRLFMTLRYRHALFDAGAAADFARLLRDTLAG